VEIHAATLSLVGTRGVYVPIGNKQTHASAERNFDAKMSKTYSSEPGG